MEKIENLSVRTKIWIQDKDGQQVFGPDRVRTLRAVKEHGSLSAPAKSLSMSYRGAWDRIRLTEERLGKQLLERKTGGRRGGGSRLTPFAEKLIDQYEKLQLQVHAQADNAFAEMILELTSG